MTTPSADVLRTTILAGTLAPGGPTRGDLPPAWARTSPEPAWAERLLRAHAPGQGSDGPVSHPAVPSPDNPLHALTVTGLLEAYASGRTDPSAVMRAVTERIGSHPSGRDAVLSLLPGAAEAAAASTARWAAGTARPLEGVPVGVKGIIDVADATVTCGSKLTGDRIAGADATVVARLRAAGAIPVAMLATTEFACGSAHNPRHGPVRNPWDGTRWTGGSSAGSGAALAAQLMPLCLGTDTGGSIRIPAAFCGITGLKPTRGLVPRTGVAPLSWTLDHVGPMARSARDLMAVMPVVAGPDGQDPSSAGFYAGDRARPAMRGLRIGVPERWFTELVDAAVLDAWRAALAVFERLGAALVPVDLGEIEPAHLDGYLILMAELASLQEPALDRMELFDPGTRARIEQGRAFSAVDYLRALRRRPLVQNKVLAAMADVDVLVTPGVGCEAVTLDDLAAEVDGRREPMGRVVARNTMLFDVTGQPALMLPAGRGRTGLPVAIQVVGRPYDDALCLSVGEAFQAATGHHLGSPG